VSAREKIPDGIHPRGASGYVNAIEAALSTFQCALGELCQVYERELDRCFNLHTPAQRVGRPPTKGPEELAAARAKWWAAYDAFHDLVRRERPREENGQPIVRPGTSATEPASLLEQARDAASHAIAEFGREHPLTFPTRRPKIVERMHELLALLSPAWSPAAATRPGELERRADVGGPA
jgi:hypothetical protein